MIHKTTKSNQTTKTTSRVHRYASTGLRIGVGLGLCALSAACDPEQSRSGGDSDTDRSASIRTDAVMVSQEMMDSIIEWQANKSGSLGSHLNSAGLLAGTEAEAAINSLGTNIDCLAFIVDPIVVSHSRKLHNDNDLSGWREAVSFRTTTEHKIDNATRNAIVGGVLGKATKIQVGVNTTCADGVDTTKVRPRLSLHSSYFGKVGAYTYAKTHNGGAAHAKLQVEGAVASNILDFATAKVFRVNSAKTLTVKASTDAESTDWINKSLIDLVGIAKTYARTAAATPSDLTDPVDPPDDGPPMPPSAPDDGDKTSFGARLAGAIAAATGAEVIDKAADAAVNLFNGLAYATDAKNFQRTFVMEQNLQQGRLTKDAEGEQQNLEIDHAYIYQMHVEYDVYGDVSAKHTNIDFLNVSRQHAHVRAQIVDDFIFAGTIGFEDENQHRIAGRKEAGFVVAGSQLPQGQSTQSYPAPDGWEADEDFVASDFEPVTFSELAPERTFSELGDELDFFFQLVWSNHPDAPIRETARGIANELKNRTPRSYSDSDDDKEAQVNVMVRSFTGQLGPSCVATD